MMAKMAWKTGGKAENQKRDLRERSLRCSEQRIYYICSYTSYITNIYVDVGKLPNYLKLLVLYLYALNQLLFCFIIQSVSNGLRIIMTKVYLRFYNCHILSSSRKQYFCPQGRCINEIVDTTIFVAITSSIGPCLDMHNGRS